MIVTCPVCKQQFKRERSTALPFCSERCQRVDLGRWLGERYAVPYERLHDPDLDETFSDED